MNRGYSPIFLVPDKLYSYGWCDIITFIIDLQMNGTGSRSALEYEGGWNSDNELGGSRCGPSSKPAGKQLQHVARQFGSLGRSVGRRIKRNLLDNFVAKHATGPGPAVVRTNSCHWEFPDFILCARLHTERHHPCLEQMITNYLQSARHRSSSLLFLSFHPTDSFSLKLNVR